MNRSKALAIVLAIASTAAIPVAVAQDNASSGEQPRSDDMQQMMQGMQGEDMMPMMRMMFQMDEMMKNCNTMMKAMTSKMDPPSEDSEEPTTEN